MCHFHCLFFKIGQTCWLLENISLKISTVKSLPEWIRSDTTRHGHANKHARRSRVRPPQIGICFNIRQTLTLIVVIFNHFTHTSLIGFVSSCHARLILAGCFPDEYLLGVTDLMGFTLDLRCYRHSADHRLITLWWRCKRLIPPLVLKCCFFHASYFKISHCEPWTEKQELHTITEVATVHWFMRFGQHGRCS